MIRIVILYCGGTFTSTLSVEMNEEARKNEIDAVVDAIPDNVFDQDYLEFTDILLLAPGLDYMLDDYKEQYEKMGKFVHLIERDYYAVNQGAKLLYKILSLYNDGQHPKKITIISLQDSLAKPFTAKMQKSVEAKGLNFEIMYTSPEEFKEEHSDKTDILLLEPHLKYLLNSYMKQYGQAGMKIDVIDPIEFGMMNVDKILDKALRL